MTITVNSRVEIESLVAILSLGLCAALESDSATISEAENYLFSPYTMSLLEEAGVSEEVVYLVLRGTQLEDFEKIRPNTYQELLSQEINKMKVLALSILRSQPELSGRQYKEHWFQCQEEDSSLK